MLNLFHRLAQVFYTNRNYRFWAFQCGGWSAYSIVTFLSITVMDDNVSAPHVLHIAMQAVLGILTSWPLRPIYRATFESPLLTRTLVAVGSIALFSALWTASRLYTFELISGEPALWGEFHYWYFGSLFVFLSWTVLYYGIHYYELLVLEHQKVLEASASSEAEKLRRVRAESLAREAQLKMLRYQLSPHFLFNTLNAINAMVRLEENRQAGEMIQSLSSFLRSTLDQEEYNDVTLDEELESLQLYLDIEKARFQDRLKLEFDIEPEARRALLPGLILQPIVENAMKYAIAPYEEGGEVVVRARAGDQDLLLEVQDSGPGVEDADLTGSRGIGIRNTLDRLETLYGDGFRFETVNRPSGGLIVRIAIPLRLPVPTASSEVA
jgi:sensor histidine kinase YesM